MFDTDINVVCCLFLFPKDEQLKLEAELARHERQFNILGNELKAHEHNIHISQEKRSRRSRRRVAGN